MRVAVVYFDEPGSPLYRLAEAFSKGISAQGYDVDLINALKEKDKKLTVYKYILVGVRPEGFFTSQIVGDPGGYLRNAGSITGKFAYAFIQKKGFFVMKSLRKLMKAVEGEGMVLMLSDIIKTPPEAELIGKKLHIEQKKAFISLQKSP